MSTKKRIDIDEREAAPTTIIQRFVTDEEAGRITPNVAAKGAAPAQNRPSAAAKPSIASRYMQGNPPSAQGAQPPSPKAASSPVKRFINTRDRAYFFHNAMENVVVNEVETTLSHMKDMCKCDQCFSDVCAIVLNNVPQFYATSLKGDLFGKSSLLNINKLKSLSTEIFKAIDIVKAKSSHNA